MVRNYVRRDVDTVCELQIKLPRAGVQTSYVHSSIIIMKKKKKNLLGYTYRIYNSGYNTEMIN